MEVEAPPSGRDVVEAVSLDGRERSKLTGYAQSRFGIGKEDAEDLLQDTFVELLRQRIYVRNPEAFLFAVFRRRCQGYAAARRASREVFSESTAAPDVTQHPHGPETLDHQVALRQALGGISSACRRLLCAFYIEGRSLREAADTLAVTEWGVSKTINRCLRRLRACMN
jgi:RNA polymerase sigma factor (sigma-70 family)